MSPTPGVTQPTELCCLDEAYPGCCPIRLAALQRSDRRIRPVRADKAAQLDMLRHGDTTHTHHNEKTPLSMMVSSLCPRRHPARSVSGFAGSDWFIPLLSQMLSRLRAA